MLETTSRKEKLLAGVAGSTLALGLAVSAGALPGPGSHDSVSTIAVLPVEPVTAAPVVQVDPAPAAAAPAAAVAVRPVVPSAAVTAVGGTTPPPSAKPPRTTGTSPKKTPARAATAPAPVAPAALTAVLPPPAAPAALATVPRRSPSASEIKATISELRDRVGGLLRFVSPTQAQIDQAGDQVCTGFDKGESFAQVKATGLSMLPSSIEVSAADADWAVRQLVTLYCPGHSGKLS